MKRILLVKTSSMGDIFHTLPALTDAKRQCPDVIFDWVVEKSFAEISGWHHAVDEVIPIQFRKWRKNLLKSVFDSECRDFLKQLRQRQYDLIIDAQGLLKSALVARLAKGSRYGYDKCSIREPWATKFYQHHYAVDKQQHAVERIRQLFAQIFDYQTPTTTADYGIRHHFDSMTHSKQADYIVFLHGTTWQTKLWPEQYWVELGKHANQAGLQVKLTSGNAEEKARADRIAAQLDNAEALVRLPIAEVGQLLSQAKGSVAVDTGFGHLCAALALPCVSLYGPTNPELTCTHGANQLHLASDFDCAPCLKRHCHLPNKSDYTVQPPCFGVMTPDRVWQAIKTLVRDA